MLGSYCTEQVKSDTSLLPYDLFPVLEKQVTNVFKWNGNPPLSIAKQTYKIWKTNKPKNRIIILKMFCLSSLSEVEEVNYIFVTFFLEWKKVKNKNSDHPWYFKGFYSVPSVVLTLYQVGLVCPILKKMRGSTLQVTTEKIEISRSESCCIMGKVIMP